MGLKSFLQQQGFIEPDTTDKAKQKAENPSPAKSSATPVAPTFFPVQPASNTTAGTAAAPSADPSFVAPLQQAAAGAEQPDPTFVKFFEEELVKSNLPGPDYFEFRQLLAKTQQKMAAKGVVAPEVVLQAVLMSFEAQDVAPAKLVEAARQYKDMLKQKNDDFLKGAATEKASQLQKRQMTLQAHDESIKKMQGQLQQLEAQRLQLEDAMNKEKMQLEADKSLGKEGIEKIERAERSISLAHNYIQSTIDMDINRLQSV